MRILLIALFAAAEANACSCRMPDIFELLQAKTLFIGEVIDGGIVSVRDDPWYADVTSARLSVVKSFRGIPKALKTVDIKLRPSNGMCAPLPYHLGRRYLVAMNTGYSELYDNGCSSSVDVEDTPEDVEVVRQHFSKSRPGYIAGMVVGSDDPDATLKGNPFDFPDTRSGRVLSGVTISATRNGKTYNTLSDQSGDYRLAVPEAGIYQVLATYKLHTSKRIAVAVSLDQPVRRNFAMQVSSTISGRLLGRNNQPVLNAKVGLVDLDRLKAEPGKLPWLEIATSSSSDGSFQFRYVPVGRYLLVSNPNGPQVTRMGENPGERSYYSGRPDTSKPQVLEVTFDGVHLAGVDVKQGKPSILRPVNVRVEFPDGVGMKSAEVKCTALPTESDQLPVVLDVFYSNDKHDGTFDFQVPADRKLEIEIKDIYLRTKKVYFKSEHEPGTAPIKLKYVVTP